jgi:ferritin-like protein
MNNNDELRYELNKQRTLNNLAYERIDELHETIYNMEQRINAMAKELKNVRNFSIDIVNDFGQHFQHVINRKWELDVQAAQDAHDELAAGYQEGIEWMEESLMNEDSEALWKIILEE